MALCEQHGTWASATVRGYSRTPASAVTRGRPVYRHGQSTRTHRVLGGGGRKLTPAPHDCVCVFVSAPVCACAAHHRATAYARPSHTRPRRCAPPTRGTQVPTTGVEGNECVCVAHGRARTSAAGGRCYGAPHDLCLLAARVGPVYRLPVGALACCCWLSEQHSAARSLLVTLLFAVCGNRCVLLSSSPPTPPAPAANACALRGQVCGVFIMHVDSRVRDDRTKC
jgi:hypothetical protein